MFDKNVCEIKVGGMMCEHCAATVKKTLEAIEGIKSAEVNLKSGTVKIKFKGDFPEPEVEKAIIGADYTYGGKL